MLASEFELDEPKADARAQSESPPKKRMLANFFKLDELKTNVRTEVIAGVTTFVTMAYIIFVNPKILSTTGMDANAVFVATCLAAAIGSTVMGLWANWPIAMAPGMGLNAFFAFTVVGKLGYTWQQALGAVFISGAIFLVLSLTGIRRWLIAGIPHSMRSAIAAGIGLFLRDHRDEERRHRRRQPRHLRHARRHDVHGRAAQHFRLRRHRGSGRAEGSRRDPDRHSPRHRCFDRDRAQCVRRRRLGRRRRSCRPSSSWIFPAPCTAASCMSCS